MDDSPPQGGQPLVFELDSTLEQTGVGLQPGDISTSGVSSTVVVTGGSSGSGVDDSLARARGLAEQRQHGDSVPDSDGLEAHDATALTSPEEPRKTVTRSGRLSKSSTRTPAISSTRTHAMSDDEMDALRKPPSKKNVSVSSSSTRTTRGASRNDQQAPTPSSETNAVLESQLEREEAMEEEDGGYEQGKEAFDARHDRKKAAKQKRSASKKASKAEAKSAKAAPKGKKGKGKAAAGKSTGMVDSEGMADESLAPKAGPSHETIEIRSDGTDYDGISGETSKPVELVKEPAPPSRRTSLKAAVVIETNPPKRTAPFEKALKLALQQGPRPVEAAPKPLSTKAKGKKKQDEETTPAQSPVEEPKPSKKRKLAGKKAVIADEDEEAGPAKMDVEEAPKEPEAPKGVETPATSQTESPRANKARTKRVKKNAIVESDASMSGDDGKIATGDEFSDDDDDGEEGKVPAKKGKKSTPASKPAAKKSSVSKSSANKENNVERPVVPTALPKTVAPKPIKKAAKPNSIAALCQKHTNGYRPMGLSRRQHVPSLLAFQREVQAKPPIPRAKTKKKDSDDDGSDLETEEQKRKRKRREEGWSSDDGGGEVPDYDEEPANVMSGTDE